MVQVPESIHEKRGDHPSQDDEDDEEEEKDTEDCSSVAHESSSSIFGTMNEQLFMNEDETSDITLIGEPVPVTPLIMFHPCPLVFYRDCCGDETAFRFLWIHMPHRLPTFSLTKLDKTTTATINHEYSSPPPPPTHGEAATLLAHVSKLMISAVDSDKIKFQAWAFQTWCGKRLFCMLAPSLLLDNNNNSKRSSFLFVRSDDKCILKTIFGSKISRTRFVCDLMGGGEGGHWDLQFSTDTLTSSI